MNYANLKNGKYTRHGTELVKISILYLKKPNNVQTTTVLVSSKLSKYNSSSATSCLWIQGTHMFERCSRKIILE